MDYISLPMQDIFSKNNLLAKMEFIWLMVAAETEIQRFGTISHNLEFAGKLFPERVAPYEKLTGHEVVGALHCMTEEYNYPYFHLGLTSSDIIDNARIWVAWEALQVIQSALHDLEQAVHHKIVQNAGKYTQGYTHLQLAEPILTSIRYASLKDISHFPYVLTFKEFSGAVGNGLVLRAMGVDKNILSLAVRASMFHRSGATIDDQFPPMVRAMSQIPPLQNWHSVAVYLNHIAMMCAKFCNDVRMAHALGQVNYSSHSVSSSAMPHKNNPTQAERVCGLSCVVRNFENTIATLVATNALERVLDNSSALRVILPQLFGYTEQIIRDTLYVVTHANFEPIDKVRSIGEQAPMLSSLALAVLISYGVPHHVAHSMLSRINWSSDNVWRILARRFDGFLQVSFDQFHATMLEKMEHLID